MSRDWVNLQHQSQSPCLSHSSPRVPVPGQQRLLSLPLHRWSGHVLHLPPVKAMHLAELTELLSSLALVS